MSRRHAAPVSQLVLATAAQNFPFFKPQHGSKRSAARPQTILFRVSLERAYRKTAVVRTDSVSRTVAVFVISYKNIKISEGPCAERH